MKPLSVEAVEKAIALYGHVSITPVGVQVRVTTWTVNEMEPIKSALRQAGIVWVAGPFMNIIYCTGIKEE